MISLLLPYWDRQAAADRAFATLDRCYAGMDDLEIIVVDDGNEVPFRRPPTKLHVMDMRLPQKSLPTSPARPWNLAAEIARGDIIVLSCVEVQHPAPVLEQLACQLMELGPRGYAACACWCIEERAWHCHSTLPVPDCPPGVGIPFCAAIHRDFFLEIGGFDEDYMEGAGYEDRDFLRRMIAAGASICVRDDLVVHHTKRDAQIKWGQERFSRNAEVFRQKWGQVTC